MDAAAVEVFLAHYGVKGMHWGVRKDRSTESRRDRAASKKAVRKVNNDFANKTADFFDKQIISKSDYDKLSSGREFVAKNSKLLRVSVSDSNIIKGKTYVSQHESDHTVYKATLPAFGPSLNDQKTIGGGKKKYRDHYEIQLQTVKKLSAPSEKERVDTFVQLMGTKSIVVSPKKPPLTGREYLEKLGYKYELKQLDDQGAGLAFYNRFVAGQGAKNPINDAYFEAIKKKGYNAIADDLDRNRLTKAPLILLDPEGTAVVTGVRKLTVDEINKAQRELAQ